MAKIILALPLFFAIPLNAQQLPQVKTFTLSSSVEMILAAGALSADAVTTRHVENLHITTEANPLARPLVSSNAGTIAYFTAAAGGLVLGNHLLRNHPRLKHAFNWSVIGGETAVAVWNSTIKRPSCERIWIQQGIMVPPCHP